MFHLSSLIPSLPAKKSSPHTKPHTTHTRVQIHSRQPADTFTRSALILAAKHQKPLNEVFDDSKDDTLPPFCEEEGYDPEIRGVYLGPEDANLYHIYHDTPQDKHRSSESVRDREIEGERLERLQHESKYLDLPEVKTEYNGYFPTIPDDDDALDKELLPPYGKAHDRRKLQNATHLLWMF
ncbi:MAG: hypothetical protein ACKO37_06865 [Vampirovibrionales bacterium]